MSEITKIFLFLLTIAVLTGAAAAQPPPPPASLPSPSQPSTPARVYQPPSLSNLPSAEKFVALDGRFTISLPKNIDGYQAVTPETAKMNVSGSSLKWVVKEGTVYVDYADVNIPNFSVKTEKEYDDYFAGVTKTTLDDFKATLTSSTRIRLGEMRGIRVDFQLANGLRGSFRDYLTGLRKYDLTTFYQAEVPDSEQLINRTFDTFVVMSQKDADAEIRRRVEQATPATLPQEPAAKKERSDAEDVNLKGRVKIVTKELEDLSENWGVQGRQLSEVDEYDEKGNRIKSVNYRFNGLPIGITVYGFIDGARVSNSRTVTYEYDPPAGIPVTVLGAEKVKRDTRYDLKHEYRYLDGKLSEDQWVRNDGTLWMHYVYTYKDRTLEESVYSPDGKLNQKYLSVLDEKGNEIERVDVALSEYRKKLGDLKFVTKYDAFDEKGNWTKKTTYKVVTENGQPVSKPGSITYRTIVYYK